MKFQHSLRTRLKRSTYVPSFAMVLMLLGGMQLCSSGATAQSKDTPAHTPYTLPVPAGWTTEEFPLPPDFAPSFTWKGVEDIRFHPGWGDSTSTGYWSYTYLWWLEGNVTIAEPALQQNLRAYYAGLVGRNIEQRKIPASKVIPTEVAIKKGKRQGNDKATFTGTVRMLDYMTQRPMVLNCIVHVKEAGKSGKSAVLVAVSPQAIQQPVWNQFNSIGEGLVIP